MSRDMALIREDANPNVPMCDNAGADVVLRDGSTVRVRSVRVDDEPALLTFLRALESRSRWLRFFVTPGEAFLAKAAREYARADPVRELALVALGGLPERIVAHAHYVAIAADRAEVALTVADAYQGRGLGTLLLGQLAEHASAHGIDVFEAMVLPANHAMLAMLRESGLPLDVRRLPGEIHVTFPTAFTAEARSRFDDRDRGAAVNAVRKFLTPRGIAVVGASRRADTVGRKVLENLVSGRFAGRVYAVNPRAAEIAGVPAYATVESIPGVVDLAVIAVPAARVLTVAEECARKGVGALLVMSAGFAEIGAVGAARQADLVRLCRATGMRLIGPNCLGLVNTDPDVRLHATFAPVEAPAGPIAFLSQSGALGLAIIDHAVSRGLGLSSFVSVGNKADVSGNDFLQFWEADPRTRVILLYLESFGNPRKFGRLARRVAREKPIVAVKSGRSAAGSRAAGSHTGALVAADVTVDALFAQAGVIRTDTLEQMLDIAALLAHQPLPRGKRVGIVTNAGGPAILCADTCEAEGLDVPTLSDRTQARLREFLPAAANVANPVDMIATAAADDYARAVRAVAADASIDALVVIFIAPLATRSEDVARALVAATRKVQDKPILAVFMSAGAAPAALSAGDRPIPSYAFPEDAAIALARAVRHADWRARPAPTSARVAARREEAAAVVATALAGGGGWLPAEAVAAILRCYGVPLIEQRFVANADAAASAATEMGGPVALKAVAPGVLHKTEAGAVRLGLIGAEAVRQAASEIGTALATAGHRPDGFLVQRIAPAGVEMIIGVVHDPSFGPVVACGAGGVLVELVRDVAVRLTPVSAVDAAEMIRGLKSYPLLTGFRGGASRDIRALEDVLVRISALADDVPEIAELDCNPVIVATQGAYVVDARIRVEAAPPPALLGARTRA